MYHDTKERHKVWTKTETLGSKNGKKDLVNFNASSDNSENLHFDVLLLSKVYHVWTKNCRGIMCHNAEEWCKIWRRTDSCFGKWHEGFRKLWPNSRKSQNLPFNGLLFMKVYNVSAKKVQRSYVSYHWRMMQNLKRNWLVLWKMTWGIWRILI